ncbi:hypothetical protein GCM10028808_57670 [Spirosoma migulaei]
MNHTPVTNKDSSSYTVGPGRTGAIISSEEKYAQVPLYEFSPGSKGGRLSGVLSTTADLSDNMPPPDYKGQGFENSCVAWAVGYSVRSYLYHIQKGTSYWSGLNIRNDKSVFSPRFMYNLIRLPGPQDKGSDPEDALKLLASTGICTWSISPYREMEYLVPVSDIQKQDAANYKSAFWGGVPKNDVSKIKDIISGKKVPVIICIQTDAAFQAPHNNIGNGYEKIAIGKKQEIFWRKHGVLNKDLAHAMVIVGYDDNSRAFKVMNSYGSGWANQGFIWIDYDLFSELVIRSYFATNTLDDLKRVQAADQFISFDIDGKSNRIEITGTRTNSDVGHASLTSDCGIFSQDGNCGLTLSYGSINQSITLIFNNFDSKPGVYSFKVDPKASKILLGQAIYKTLDPPSETYSFPVYTETNQLTVTYVDESKKVLEGTFNFTLYNSKITGNKVFSNGSFRARYNYY